jgi:hypothetical protein
VWKGVDVIKSEGVGESRSENVIESGRGRVRERAWACTGEGVGVYESELGCVQERVSIWRMREWVRA